MIKKHKNTEDCETTQEFPEWGLYTNFTDIPRITWSRYGFNCFYHGILQRKSNKLILWLFCMLGIFCMFCFFAVFRSFV